MWNGSCVSQFSRLGRSYANGFKIPLRTFVDTPRMMVGPEAEKTGLVRHCSRLFVTGANLENPRFALILRKGHPVVLWR